MSEEKNESTELVETEVVEESTELAAWEISNYVDSWAAQADFTAYVYSFKQGNREIVDLTARAYEHLALDPRRPIDILEEKEEIVTINGVEGVLTKVKVSLDILVPALKEGDEDRIKTITRIGKNFSPFVAYGKLDEFVYQKSSTKALRNGIAKLLPATEKEAAKQELLKLQGGKPVEVPQEAVPKSQPKQTQSKAKSQPKTDDTDKERKACFAALSEISEKLFAIIPEEDFWDYIKKNYGVDSRTKLTADQWSLIKEQLVKSKEMKAFTGIIRNVILAYNADKADAEDAKESE